MKIIHFVNQKEQLHTQAVCGILFPTYYTKEPNEVTCKRCLKHKYMYYDVELKIKEKGKEMNGCFLCKRTQKDIDFIDTSVQDLQAGWLQTPEGRGYCPLCIRDRFAEIEEIENKKT